MLKKGNLLIMGAILCTEKLRKESSSIIMFSLSIAHMCVSGMMNMFGLIGFLDGEKFFTAYFGVCAFNAVACLTFGTSGFLHVALLAVDRFIFRINYLVMKS